PGERPCADPVPLPAPDWEPSRLAKVERNYSMAYVRSLLPELCAVLGPADAAAVGRVAARQVAMQYHEAVMGPLGLGARPFAERLAELLSAHGDPAEVDRSAPPAITGRAPGTTIRQRRQRVLADLELPPEAFEAWNGLWEGLAAMEDQRLDVVARADRGDDATEWVVRPSARGA
ncbi:MAG: hypothetical protein OEY23_19320, partial [Acidimicrobiia bacterium]|nr:hypothetical protein [Acidimicrobiia bacterium]